MFVYPHKMILKTCGTTTLLLAVKRLLEIARSYCGFEKVWRVFIQERHLCFLNVKLVLIDHGKKKSLFLIDILVSDLGE